MLTKRLHVLLDEERLDRLRRESRRAGAPVGELVRRAIDREYPPELPGREEAGRRLLARVPAGGHEPDWGETKAAILDELAEPDSAPD
jgi:hypothetical protein